MRQNRVKYAVLAFILALIATGGTIQAVMAHASQIAHPIRVIRTNQFIPAKQPITASEVRWTTIYAPNAVGLETDPKAVLGKAAAVPLVAGQLLYAVDLGGQLGVPKNDVGIYLPVQLSASALALAGDNVDVYWVHQSQGVNPGTPAGNQQTQPTVALENVEVLASVDNNGQEITTGQGDNVLATAAQAVGTGGAKAPSAVEIAVPQDQVSGIINYMDQGGNFYLGEVSEGG